MIIESLKKNITTVISNWKISFVKRIYQTVQICPKINSSILESNENLDSQSGKTRFKTTDQNSAKRKNKFFIIIIIYKKFCHLQIKNIVD